MVDISNSTITLNEALANLDEFETLFLGSRIFNEKIYITKPNITIIGEDAKIIYDDYHGKILPPELGGDGQKLVGTTGSATFTVKEGADNFKAQGIIFINSHRKDKNKKNQQAVAFKSEASNIELNNCSFHSEQDTLYIDLGNNIKINNCYICGDVDFIFGSASCEFHNCIIESLNNGYIIAPNTYQIYEDGFKFFDCIFKVQANYDIYLGRPWYPSGARYKVYPKALFKNCIFNSKIKLNFIKMHSLDPFKFELILVDCMYKGQLISKNLSSV